MIILTVLVSFLNFLQPSASDSLSLQACYQLAQKNYPTAKKIELQQKITELNTRVVNTRYFPQIKLNGKATYQSEVTSIGAKGPSLSKDQYQLGLNVTEPIYSGGAIGIQKKLEQAKGRQEVNSVYVDLHKLREQVNQVYFGILLSQKQSQTEELLMKNLRQQLQTVRSQVKNGALLPSQAHVLKAELIKANQDSAEIQSNIQAGYQVLGELIGKDVSTDIDLSLPNVNPNLTGSIQRPEYDLFQSTKHTLDYQKQLIQAGKYPKLAAFGSAAYGRPGYNFLNNDFHDFYIVGLKLSWNFWDWSNASDKQMALTIQQQTVEQNKKAFTRQVQAALDRIRAQIASLKQNIDRDSDIIDLREQVVQETASQLKNGVVTATEYVTVLTKANQAKLALEIHKVQLRQAQIDLETTLGNSIEP